MSSPLAQLARSSGPPTVDILMTVYNGVPYVEEQIASFEKQSYPHWRLHVRDDGSSDATLPTIRRLAAVDHRIRLVEPGVGPRRLGALGGFAWLIDNAAQDADYIMFSDADDRWLPNKIEVTLAAMLDAEGGGGGAGRVGDGGGGGPGGVRKMGRAGAGGRDCGADGGGAAGRAGRSGRQDAEGATIPVLVHTDLVVVDRDLRMIAPSLWRYQGVDGVRVTLNRLLVQNSVTGCTVMINRALRERGAPVPEGAVMHDWWLALVATCFGRIVPVQTGTILYRQHGGNDTGARPYPAGARQRVGVAWRSLTDTAPVRDSLRRTARQAEALLERFGENMPAETRKLVAAYSELPRCGPLTRRWRLLDLRTLPHGLERNLGYLLRV